MKMIFSISIAFLFAVTALSAAEENVDLMQGSYIGEVSENEEYDTFGYKSGVKSDLDIRFDGKYLRKLCAENVPNLIVYAKYVGQVTGNEEYDTFGGSQ